MIKIGNHIRFGKHILVVEGIDSNHYLLKDLDSKVINWVKKSTLKESITPIIFSNILSESSNSSYFYKDDSLSILIEPFSNGSRISIIEEGFQYTKDYPYNISRTKYEFNKFFNYVNELTPYKLKKYGFQKKEV